METIIIKGGAESSPTDERPSVLVESSELDHPWQSFGTHDQPVSPDTFRVDPDEAASDTLDIFIKINRLGPPSGGCFRPHDYIIVADRNKRFRKDRYHFEINEQQVQPHEAWKENTHFAAGVRTVFLVYEDDAPVFQIDYNEEWADVSVQTANAQLETQAPLLECKPDAFGGTGLFARVDLPPGKLHLHYWGEMHKGNPRLASKYLMEDVRGNWFDGDAVPFGLARFVNHSPAPNMTRVVSNYPYLVFTNNTTVRAGEELVSDYGPNYNYKTHKFERGIPCVPETSAFVAPTPVARDDHLVGIDSDWLQLLNLQGHPFYQHAVTSDVRVYLPVRSDIFATNQAQMVERILTKEDVHRLYANLADTSFKLHHLQASHVPALWQVPETFKQLLSILKHDRGPFSVNLGSSAFTPEHLSDLEHAFTSSNVCFYFFSPSTHNFPNQFWTECVKTNQKRLIDSYRHKGWRIPWFMYRAEDTTLSTYSQDQPTVNNWIQTEAAERGLWEDFSVVPWNAEFVRSRSF